MDNQSVPGPQWTPEMRNMMAKVLPKDVTALIKSLIPMLAGQTYIYLGKVDNPLQGGRTRDLTQAFLALECTIALQDKIDGFLTEEERAQFRGMRTELQMNYAEERQKGD